MALQIQLRRDTATNWTSSNPTLAQGEVGIETNTGKFKIGTGSTAWTSLAYSAPTFSATSPIIYADGVISINQALIEIAQSQVTNLTTALSGKQAVVSGVDDTEIGYLNGVTSAIQTQIDSKQATITGGATSITATDLTSSRALASDASGKVAVSAVTATELGYVSGVTSAIQTQIDTKASTSYVDTGLSGKLDTGANAVSATTATTATNLAGGTAGKVPYQSGTGTTVFTDVGTAGQILTSNGTSAPTWSAPAAGGEKISSFLLMGA
jgi:hypothetical protein